MTNVIEIMIPDSYKDRKQCGKRRKCWLPAFSPFPTMFSKGYPFRVIKSQDCVVKDTLTLSETSSGFYVSAVQVF